MALSGRSKASHGGTEIHGEELFGLGDGGYRKVTPLHNAPSKKQEIGQVALGATHQCSVTWFSVSAKRLGQVGALASSPPPTPPSDNQYDAGHIQRDDHCEEEHVSGGNWARFNIEPFPKRNAVSPNYVDNESVNKEGAQAPHGECDCADSPRHVSLGSWVQLLTYMKLTGLRKGLMMSNTVSVRSPKKDLLRGSPCLRVTLCSVPSSPLHT